MAAIMKVDTALNWTETKNKKQAYAATVDLFFDYNDERIKIESQKISYILVEHDYENQVLPVIYISVSVNSDLYSKITKYKDSAKFYLEISRTNKKSDLSLTKTILKGSFNYIPSTTNPNYQENMTDSNEGLLDSTYKKIMIGLVSIDLTNTLRKSFNNVYNNIDQKTLIGMALEDTNCIIEQPTYNKSYESVLIPPIETRYRLLDFIFEKDNFYDTRFRYFMDFEKSYLLSRNGNTIDAGDGDINDIIIDIRSLKDPESFKDGIVIQNNAYYVYVNPSQSNVSLDIGTEKVANQLVTVADDRETQVVDLNINNTEGSTTKQIFLRSKNAALYKNEMETNTVTIEVVKQHIDGAIFKPNKSIMVNNYGEYKKYDGKYLLLYKREFFRCVAGEFLMSCILGLKKIGNVQPAETSTGSTSVQTYSSSATKSSTANIKNNNRPATNFDEDGDLEEDYEEEDYELDDEEDEADY